MLCPNCGTYNLPGNEICTNCHQDLTPLDLPTPQSELERSLMEDPISCLPPCAPLLVRPETSVPEVMQIMLDHNRGAVLVIDAHGHLLGIFTERDILKKIAGIHEDYSRLRVNMVMTPQPETVALTDTLNFALHKMDVGGYRHLPVVNGEQPVGIVSVRDMLRHMTRLCQ